jgi:hypothetical protein
MRKHPLIALTAFTALGASAIAGASTGSFESTSVLSSARAHSPSATMAHATVQATTVSYVTPVSTRDLGVMHDPTRPSGLILSNFSGRPVAPVRHVHKAHKAVVAVTESYPAPVVTTTTQPAPPPTTTPPTTVAPAPAGGVWYELRMCESGDNYAEDTGNGYYGAYQFALSTWYGLGFTGLPSDASPAVQDQAARELQAESGWGQWPSCSAQLGL